MPTPKFIELSVPEPCSQPWGRMKGDNDKRHCNKCATDVIDFTRWSDAQLFDFFTTNTAHVCGRFSCHQLHRHLAPKPVNKSKLHKYFVALGLSLVLGLPVADARTNYIAPHRLSVLLNSAQQDDEYYAQHNLDSTGIQIHVKTKRSRDPEQFWIIVLRDGKEVFAESPDGDGNLRVPQLAEGAYTVVATHYGDKLKEINDIDVQQGKFTRVTLKLKMDLPQHISMGCPRF